MMKRNSVLHLLCIIVSIGLYHNAPNNVDYLFNIYCFALFLIQSILVLTKDFKSDGFINFNLVFLLSFFFVTYAFPLIIWGTPLFKLEGVQAYVNYNLACKCTALCTVAISVYFFSYQQSRNNIWNFGSRIVVSNLVVAYYFYLVAFIAILYLTLMYIRSGGGIAVKVGQWYNIYIAALTLGLICNCERDKVGNMRQFVASNKLIIIPAFIVMVMYIILGDRGLVIISTFIIVAVYHYKVKQIKPKYFLLGSFLGVVLMFSLKVTRTTESSLSSGDTNAFIGASTEAIEGANFITLFSDLTQIHRELYLGYEYWERNGLLEPQQFIIIPFYPFPVIPSALSKTLWGKTMEEIKPGSVLNEYMAYSGHGHFGIHCVIDVFMRYGLIGVIILFYFWGYMVSVITRSKYKSFVCFVFFVILFASSIRLPRAPLLDITRIFFWVIVITWISSLFSPEKRVR